MTFSIPLSISFYKLTCRKATQAREFTYRNLKLFFIICNILFLADYHSGAVALILSVSISLWRESVPFGTS